MPKTTVLAPSNIAFIKYWGALDLERAVPVNRSISMTLARCTSRCTVEIVPGPGRDDIRWRGADGALGAAPPAFTERIDRHLAVLRRWGGVEGRFRVATENSFPAAAGIASSASGFAALTLAVVRALDRDLDPGELSSLARLSGSGSAARSVMGGYVEWPRELPEDCRAIQVAPAEHWDLRNVIAIVESGPKAVSSLAGHRRAATSPYYETRQRRLPQKLEEVRVAIRERDLGRLGPILEAEAVDLHCVAMTSVPAIFYWKPGTLEVLEAVRAMRSNGLEAYATMDAGANVHVLCEAPDDEEVAGRLQGLEVVQSVLRDHVGSGPVEEREHLF